MWRVPQRGLATRSTGRDQLPDVLHTATPPELKYSSRVRPPDLRQARDGSGHDRAAWCIREQPEQKSLTMHHLAPEPAVPPTAQSTTRKTTVAVKSSGDVRIGVRRRDRCH